MNLITQLWVKRPIGAVCDDLTTSTFSPTHWYPAPFLRQEIEGAPWIDTCRRASAKLSRINTPRAHIDIMDANNGFVGLLIASDETITPALCEVWERATDALCMILRPQIGAAWLSEGQGPILNEADVEAVPVQKIFSVIFVDPTCHRLPIQPLVEAGASVQPLADIVKVTCAPICSRAADRSPERMNAIQRAFMA